MAVLHNLDLAVPLPQRAAVLKAVGAAFWDWADQHADDVVFRTKVWFVSVSITVKQLEPVFIHLFGPR